MHKFGKAFIASIVIMSMTIMPAYAAEEVTLEIAEEPAVDTGITIDESADIDTLRLQLATMLKKIDEIEKDSVSKGEEINKAHNDLKEAQEKEEKQYEAMKLRIRYMYETGNESIIESLLNAKNIVDALNKAEYANEISIYDRGMILNYVNTQTEIKALKTTLMEEQQELLKLKDAFTEQQGVLSNLIEQKQAELDAAQVQKAYSEALITLNTAISTDETLQAIYQEAVTTGDFTTVESYIETNSSVSSSFSPSVWNTIIEAAYSQIGVGYVYGSQNPGVSFDCSGFVQYCYSQAGIDIPRTSGEIAANGTTVSQEDAQPGDIMWEEGHVLIYLGDGKCIDSKTEGTTIDIRDINTEKDYTYVRY